MTSVATGTRVRGDIDELNRLHWDALAAVHGNGTDTKYDVAALRAGRCSLLPVERAALERAMPDLAGRQVLHVQCHLGFDAVTMARAGAHVTGLDFSPEALRKARRVAEDCGVDVGFVEANAMRIPETLWGRFDLAYATLGIFGWIYDVEAWMRSVAGCLRPGGKLVIVDFHPYTNMFKSLDPPQLWGPYHHSGPQIDNEDGSYAQPADAVAFPRKARFSYNLAEVLSAACAAGLRIDFVGEHEDSGPSQIRALQAQEPDGAWRSRLDGYALPVLFTLNATKP
jgi:SAM-dependent methyltransferase